MEQNCDIVTAFHKAHYYRSPQTIRQLGASGVTDLRSYVDLN